MTPYNLQILQIIQSRTKERPITGKDIINILKIKEDPHKFGAKLRQIVNALRCEEYPICASGNGYYWPENAEEFKKYLDSFKNRILAMHKAYEPLLKSYNRMNANWIAEQQSKERFEQIKVLGRQPVMI